ncbi:hypothetical protein SAMN02745136_02756 [Anaerocolumna jejuensis DSM 15929]|uniref:Polymerase/histidinol phosphatase N-terminal domain-containing protein n=1 Tax=Anaerocolumna jejuensis DSM 15929 TaxID=1121322 RepID=A0A1M6TDE2_9FIRM|nr:CehA/McbA family metallohydrolase [Anaerocolumna jejuensis]SHK55052.1 hypothetical protein SAMN02745136_02756 [Anaerocolumna jejuensis DSM 15929]
MQKEILITGNITSAFFDIEKPEESIWVKIETEEKVPMTVALFNPEGILCGNVTPGIGNFIREIYISKEVCTLTGLRHELLGGRYRLFFLPGGSLEEGGCPVKILVETDSRKSYPSYYCYRGESSGELSFDTFYDREERYYKGDFHGHTIFSDGHNNIEEAAEILADRKMDFMTFTEHNAIAYGESLPSCLLIPSLELTLPIGHMNIHGIKPDKLLYELLCMAEADSGKAAEKEGIGYDALWEGVTKFLSEEANLSLNHMFLTPWQFCKEDCDLTGLHTIEVICDPTYPDSPAANDKAEAFLDFLWNRGLHLYGIGGSDSHNRREEFYENSTEPSIYGDPSTYVYCRGLSVNNLIKGIKAGNCYVARYVELDISICQGRYLPGNEITVEEEIEYRVTVRNVVKPMYGVFWLNGGKLKEQLLTEGSEMSCQVYPNGDWWLRFGIYDENRHVICYVNPIYKSSKAQKPKPDFKILWEEFRLKNALHF